MLDDYSRYIVAWNLCTGMKVADVTDTLDLALKASEYASANVRRRGTVSLGKIGLEQFDFD